MQFSLEKLLKKKKVSANLELGRKPGKLLIRPKHINPKPLVDYDHDKCKKALYENYSTNH